MRSFDAARRQCARFGCTAVATATFTFDSAAGTVWLDTPFEGAPRAGELCSRHARLLTPPRGWRLEDRRPAVEGHAVVQSRPFVEDRPVVEAREAVPAPVGAGAAEEPAPESRVPARQLAAGPADGELEDELRGLLDAHSPLLARAFRSSGTV
jgi:hypothetical protein